MDEERARAQSSRLAEATAVTEPTSRWFQILIVVTSFFATFFIWGTLFTFTVYAESLGATFGISTAEINSVFSAALFAFFASIAVGGVILTRAPIRPVLFGTTTLAGIAVVAMQVITSYAGLAGAYVLFGISFGTMFVSILSLVPQWFDQWENLALGATVSGNGFGGLIMPIVWQTGIQQFGIRKTFLFVGVGLIGSHVVATLVLRRPDYRSKERDVGGSATVSVEWLRQLAGKSRFWYAFAGMALSWAWYYILTGHLVAMLTRVDVSTGVAAGAFGLIGGVSILSRIISGVSADYVGGRKVFVATLGITTLGIIFLLERERLPAVYLTVTLFGVGLGGISTLTSPILLQSYGRKNGTAVIGVFNVAAGIAGFVAPMIPTVILAETGSYTPSILLMSIMTALGGVLFWYGTSTESYHDN